MDIDPPDLPDGAALAAPPPPLPALTQRQKAAIVLRALVAAEATLPIATLPDRVQADLVRELGALGPLDHATVDAVIAEFEAALGRAAFSAGGGLDGALALVGDAVAPAVAQRLRLETGAAPAGEVWDSVRAADPERLLGILESESTEVAAIVLSKLKVSVAADLLSRLPGERARRITYAISLTAAAPPDTVEEIGTALSEALAEDSPGAYSGDPVEHVGAILNAARSSTRDDVLSGLQADDAAFAEDVRRAIFTFANIPGRVDARDIPRIVRQVEQPTLVRALVAAERDVPEAFEFLLGSLPPRMAGVLRDEMTSMGEVPAELGEDAMAEVVTAIRALEDAGEIYLVSSDA